MSRYIIGVTGASGAPYARKTLQALCASGHEIDLVVSDSGRKVLEVEENVRLTEDIERDLDALSSWLGVVLTAREGFTLHNSRNVAADIASGSCRVDGMAIVPCSGGTLARVAHGISQGLIERAADVALKERRRLILVPRETPLSLVHIRNMAAVTEAGAIVLPASPGFYNRPNSIDDLVEMIAGRILHHLGAGDDLLQVWRGA